ncbi:Not1-domain-containing protein [Panaeolus papilionaceus]|nr:Not1-domain-containing protein [Panaeolus papilionaceus]
MDNPPPTTNIHTIVKAQIVFLLSTLTEENFERNQMEIRSLSEQHGPDTYIHFIRRLIVHSQTRLQPNPPPPAFDASISLTFRLLVQETQRLARDPYLADRFRDGIGGAEAESFRNFDFARFSDRVGLRSLERLVLSAAIVSGQTRKELVVQAVNMIRTEFEGAMLELLQTPPMEHADLSPHQMKKLLSNLLVDVPQDAPVLDAAQRQALIAASQSKFGKDTMGPILGRLMTKLSLPPNSSLIQVLVQLGPDATSDPEVVRGLLERFGITHNSPPTDAQVVELISTLARLAAEGSVICDVGSLVRAFVSYEVPLNWPSVIKSFDWPDRHGVDTATLKILIAILLNSPRETEPHAVTGFWGDWNNPLYQLRLLDALLSLPADTFNFVQLPGRRIVTVDDVSIASPTIKSLAANVQGQTWNSLELFQVLVRLSRSDAVDIRNCVREMLDKAIKISAEIVHMGLLQVPDMPWTDIRLEYSHKLLSMFLAGHPNHQLVFMRIWQIQPSYLTNAFRDFYEENPVNISRILDVAQDLKILESLLEVRPFTFALDIAALASRREYLNLDKWLADNVTAHGSEFLQSVIQFLDQKMENEKTARLSDPGLESRTMSLNPSTITIILRILRNNTSLLDPNTLHEYREVRNLCLQVHPRLMSLMPNSDVEPGLTVITYPNEIESEVDNIYRQMYDESITIDEVIAMLQRYKESNNPRDHEVFSCMIHFLFDEYKFFQSYYPARELAMTGYLFGSLIRHSLIEYIPLTIAVRYILDALNCTPDSNLFKFGIQALSRFEVRLPEWKPLCETLLRIQHLVDARPDLAVVIQRALATPHEPSTETGAPPPAVPSQFDARPPFTAIRPDTIDESLDSPPEEISDKILFIVNNLAPSNFDDKVKEMREQFVDSYSRWFANYLIDQRISTEPNNHPLYLRFLDALDRQHLFKLILQETFVKAAALLNSDRSISGSDRNALKNVGTWLGTITLARDNPIRHKNLSFKDLLIEGYESNRLVVAIPFVCKTLEPCAKSKVFKPPNPWLMAVISLLAELYHFAELKLNLKFDIELLCKGLDIDLSVIEPTNILRNRPMEALNGLGMGDYPEDISLMPIGNDGGQFGDSQVLALNGHGSPEAPRQVGAHIESILATLVHSVRLNAQLAPYHVNPNFKRAVQMAVDRAVREIILPVIERSVTIAGISTRELVAKDFATEPNEDKLRRAGHLMAQKLAGSLALVTCKDPLKSNLATHIRQHLSEHGFGEQLISEQVVSLLVQDNLDIACAAIEKAAMERAVTDVDDGFTASYEARRRHREIRSTASFWDPHVPRSDFSSTLPDPLIVKLNGVQPHQAMVYEDFGMADTKRRVDSRPGSVASFGTVGHYATSPALDHTLNHPVLITHAEALERFATYTRDLEAVMLQYPNQSLASLPQNHDVRHLVRQIYMLADEALERDRTSLILSQKIVQFLYKTSSPLGREVYVAILDQLCRTFEEVAKEAIAWLLYAEDERKYNVPVTVTLLRSGLINPSLQDRQLAKLLLEDGRQLIQNFASNVIRECLSADPPFVSQAQFMYSIDVLSQLVQENKATEDANRLIDDLHGIVRRPTIPSSDPTLAPQPMKPEMDQLREKLFIWFQQWINIFQRSSSPEKSFVPFITQLTKQGILKVEDVSSFFFRVCAESSVNSYTKCMSTGEYDLAFHALDAMSRLIVYIIKYHGDASGVNNDQAKVHYLTKILSIFVLVLANHHEEQGANFQPKPFFRFFSSLVNDLHSIESHLGPVYFQLLIAISETYSSLQPTYFPGFAFSWMGLISHRLFMPKLLLSENREGWAAFHKLLLSLFKFLAPLLKDADLQAAGRDLYRGALRLLLVILHDFPEFLSEYYFTLCDVIPPRCIQLRNLILSAFPPTITLPDPHLRNHVPEMGPIPPVLSDFASGLKSNDLRGYLDQYLLNRGTPSFLASLPDRLKSNPSDAEASPYNLSLINSLVMYIGVSSVAQAKARSGSSLFVASDPGVVALQYLAMNLDVEGQHHLLSSIVLHLRYPNAHTHWFSSLLLHLFAEINDNRFREVMTKILLERFIVHRPHPWGALVTFIELLRNPKYDFWSKEFIRIAPEVTLLLESVARSIFQQ